uniref:Ig-like domain-containing protein n=1 Tax=Astatotilapia calliptera TaxID=8154 RepID=A0A3P8NKY4_ASTCA
MHTLLYIVHIFISFRLAILVFCSFVLLCLHISAACGARTQEFHSHVLVQWYKQSVGDALKLVVTFYGTTQPVYTPEFPESRFEAKIDKNFGNLTIVKTVQEDEGYYHCEQGSCVSGEWSGMYLLMESNPPTESNPLHPGDTATLQCSVLTNSENNTCSGHHNVFWFRDGSNKSLPNIIYTHGNRTDQCEKRSDPQDGCVYRFSKNVGSSDAGTYYCAVATCGEILFGNGTTLDVQVIKPFLFVKYVCTVPHPLLHVCVLYTLSVTAQTEADDDINYAALSFSERKTRGRRTREHTEDTVFS